MIKAVIFDCDGLLIDTEFLVYKAHHDLYERYEEEFPFDLYVRNVGRSFNEFDPLQYLQDQLHKTFNMEQMRASLREEYMRNIQEAGLLPGVERYLQDAKKAGLKIGLASNSDKEWVTNILKQNQIIKYFDEIFTKDHVQNVKPHPEIYLKTLHSLGVKAEEAIVFEDSLSGSEAAKEAGAHCVIVPNRMTKNLPFKQFDLRLESMTDMSLADVMNEISDGVTLTSI